MSEASARTIRQVTADELLAMPEDGLRRELVRGELRTMTPTGSRHGSIRSRTHGRASSSAAFRSNWTAVGTSNGPILGAAPTGRRSTVFGFWMHRFEGDQIAEEWATWDTHGFLRQIGLAASAET